MSTLIKLTTILLCLNIFMYIGLNFASSADGSEQLNEDLHFRWNGDLFDTLLQDTTLQMDNQTAAIRDNWTVYSPEFNSEFNQVPGQEGGTDVGTGGISFLDSLKIFYSIVPTLYNIAASPLILFFNFRIPPFVGFMIGFPYIVILSLAIISAIRGIGD